MVAAEQDHDRTTAAPSRSPTGADAIGAALHGLRLEGAIFFRAEFTEGWAYESPPPDVMAQTLHPGAHRLIMFHIVAAGRCWIERGDGNRHWAAEGDVIVLPYGDQHRVGGAQPATVVPAFSLFDPPPWPSLPVVHHGAGGPRTDIVCGYLHSEHPLFAPTLAALPPVLVVRPPGGPAAQWIRSSIDYALAASSPGYRPDPFALRLPELVLIETLRLHLATSPAIDSGWLVALTDPILGPAMEALHTAPQRRWSVDAMARTVSVSRSLLDERFRQVLRRSPMRYLTDWRMHVAKDLLSSTDQPVATIAHRVGYDSEEAFSRAFKRDEGVSPGAWRRGSRAGVTEPTPLDAMSE